MKVAVLGCTGSIGRQTLDVIAQSGGALQVVALSAGSRREELAAAARLHGVKTLGIADPAQAGWLAEQLPGAEIYAGKDCNEQLCRREDVEAVVIALTGMQAIFPLLEAIRCKKRIALANKESIVCAGEVVNEALARYGGRIYPVDSEHSAIFQCLQGIGGKEQIRRLILTASGGAFRDWSLEQMKGATAEQALRHPNWAMGPKITIDCATMANKGLEVLEARGLFGVEKEQISVLIHPQSIVHSMVETVDGAVLAQMGTPDMRLPIQYALTHPERRQCPAGRLDFAAMGKLEFREPDFERFPALKLAFEALRAGGTAGAVYNGANEEAVKRFMRGEIGFLDIAKAIESALDRVTAGRADTLEAVLEADRQARAVVKDF
jgi:1-deoxy-D-xylulose-5-phosphate reductoisomerase